jgi:hypothetical protein
VETVPGWGRKTETHNYCDEGGWKQFRWEGVWRVTFVFRRASGDPAADTTCYIITRGRH